MWTIAESVVVAVTDYLVRARQKVVPSVMSFGSGEWGYIVRVRESCGYSMRHSCRWSCGDYVS